MNQCSAILYASEVLLHNLAQLENTRGVILDDYLSPEFLAGFVIEIIISLYCVSPATFDKQQTTTVSMCIDFFN